MSGDMQKMWNVMALTGETVVAAGAAWWLWMPGAGAWLLTVGTVLLVVGRMASKDGDGQRAADSELTPAVRHLYRQRILSYVLLALAAVCVHLPAGFYWGVYMRRSMWLVPFIAFAVIEVYTAFRLPAAEKHKNR